MKMTYQRFISIGLPFLIMWLMVVPISAETAKHKDLTFNLDIGPDWMIKEQVEPTYAKHFKLLFYENGYKLIAMSSGESYLIAPKEEAVPKNLAPEITVIPGQVTNIFVANTGVMSFLVGLESLDRVRFTAISADEWYIPEVTQAMADEAILFAGKYREPDYELLTAENCRLVLFNTGIRKHDKVLSMLDNLDIPYLIDLASAEDDPLGRLEWIKVYGALLDQEEAANDFFEQQVNTIKELDEAPKTERKVAVFYLNKEGDVLTRKSHDYIAGMIQLAGGQYAIADTTPFETKSSLVKMGMEDFYLQAKDADILIYNGMITGHPDSLDEILAQNPLWEEFAAVKQDRCYSIGKNFFQISDQTAEMIAEFQAIIHDDATADGIFLQHLSKTH